MGSPSSIGINDNLTSGEPGVSVGSSNDEATRGVEMVNGLVVKVLLRDHRFDDVIHKSLSELFLGNIFRMLGGDDNGMDALWDRDAVDKFVLAGNLGLSVRADEGAGSVLAHFG